MRRGIVAAATVAASLAGAATAQAPARPAHWLSGPSDPEIAAAWPAAARAADIKGEVRMECAVSAQGFAHDCKILDERPAGKGFGKAAMSLLPQFHAAPAKRGGVPVDSVMRFILRFPPDTSPFPDGGAFVFPQAVEKPSDEQVYAAWPRVARANGVEGSAELSCTVSLYGELADCRVAEESPRDLGFGQAALRLTEKFRFEPGQRDMMSVAMRTPITVQFLCKSRCTPLNLPVDFKGRLVAASWKATPSLADLEAAYPREALASHTTGKVMLFCLIRPDGGVRGCTATSEQPKGMGFAQAALSLTELFKVNPAPAATTADLGVQIPVAFSAESGAPLVVQGVEAQELKALTTKAALDPKALEARSTLHCVVGEAGFLKDCTASDESPAGVGVGEAALGLAPKLQMSVWGENGRPTLGGKVTIPFRVALEERQPKVEGVQNALVIAKPDWIERPSASDVDRFYPKGFLGLGSYVEGDVRLNCTVNVDGRLRDCFVAFETPPDKGFGKAALKMSALFRMRPVMVDGTPVAGASVTVPILFRVAD